VREARWTSRTAREPLGKLLDAALLGLPPHPRKRALPAGQPSQVPTAVSVFGGEQVPFPKPPRELAERYFTITTWHEHERGGHFPAVAEPHLLAQTPSFG
jgi:hypothetical protein